MKRFRKIYVEITNICNMNCSFCPNTTRKKDTMSVEAFEHIAKQIINYTDYVYLHVKGEPLLHKHLQEILDICSRYNLKVNISTNGTLLKEKYELLKEIRQLNVSLHSFENQDKNMLNTYLNEVFDVCSILANSGVIIRYKLWNVQDEQKVNDINNNILEAINSRYNTSIENTVYNKDQKIAENTYLSIKAPFKWPDMEGKKQLETTCYGLRNQIAILVDGTVVPCCVDNNGDIKLGNIFESSLEEILNSDYAMKIKKGFEQNKCVHTLCKKCEYRNSVI